MLQNRAFITCPKCGERLTVTNPQNVVERSCRCPLCGQRMIIRFGKSYHEGYVPIASSDGNTILPRDLEAMQSCFIVYNDICYQLSIGVNRIGRSSKTCKADIKLDTNDGYTSRQHITITVSRKADGNLEAVLRNDQNKNRTRITNDKGEFVVIEDNDAIVLHHGTHIKMANTEVVFQAVSGHDGDTTII